MAIGVALAIGQKLLGGLGNGIKDGLIEWKGKQAEEETKRIAIKEQTSQMQIEKEIAEKGLQESYNTLQEQKEKTKQSEFATKQAEIQAKQSTYNTFAEKVTEQTRYDYTKLTNDTNDYLARFRPDFTKEVFNKLIWIFKICVGYYGIAMIGYLILFLTASDSALFQSLTKIEYEDLLIFPIPQNVLSAILMLPMWGFYLIYEQWTYMQTYWFIVRCEEKKNS